MIDMAIIYTVIGINASIFLLVVFDYTNQKKKEDVIWKNSKSHNKVYDATEEE